jgi:Mg-chelatase subunit ChlD
MRAAVALGLLLGLCPVWAAEGITFDALDTDNGRWTLDQWTQIRPDGLHLTRSKIVWAYDATDGYIELHTEHVSGPPEQAYGLCFRCARPNGEPNVSGYVLYIASNGGWRLLKLRGGNYEPMVDWQACPFLHQGLGEWNILGVLCRGSQFKLYINGRAVAMANDTDFPSGGAGPANAGGEGSDVAYRYLIIDPNARQPEQAWRIPSDEARPEPLAGAPPSGSTTSPASPSGGGTRPTLGGSVRPDEEQADLITITLNAILGPDGRPLANLSPANFQVFEDGAPREVVSVGQVSAGTRTTVDLAFLLDQTGSMGTEIRGVADSVVRFADYIAGRGVGIRLAGIAFRDDVDLAGSCGFTSDFGQLKSWALGLRAAGGDDTPESGLEAMMAAVRSLQWRPEAQRLLVVITDAPMHTRLNGRSQLDPATVAAELRAGGFAVHVVSTGMPLSGTIVDAKVIANATGGLWVRLPTSGRVNLTTLPLTDVVLGGQVVRFRATPTNAEHRVRLVLLLDGRPVAEQEFNCRY